MPSTTPSTAVWPICRMFGLNIQAARFADAAAQLTAVAAAGSRPAQVVVTPNVDHLVRLDAAPELMPLYVQADYIFADGMPVVWASKALGGPVLPERVTGADLFVALARNAAVAGLPMFVIGGMPGQEGELEQAFARVYPGLRAQVFAPSMQFDPLGAEGEEALRRIAAMQPAIVFVCLGMPKQERFALLQRERIAAPLVLCVGAAMEFALGFKQRAPMWMQKSGLEWFWRLASEPRRLWRRYLVQSTRFARLFWRERNSRRRDNHIH